MSYIFGYTFKVMNRRKQRMLLSGLAIALGISLVVQSQVLNDTFIDTYLGVFAESLGETDLIVSPKAGTSLYIDQDVYDTIVAANVNLDFKGIIPKISHFTTVYFADKGQIEQGVHLEAIGTEYNAQDQRDFWEELTNEDGETIDITELTATQAIISKDLSEDLEVEVDDEVLLTLFNETGEPIFHNVTITHIFKDKGYGKLKINPADPRKVIMNLQEVQPLINVSLSKPISNIYIGIKEHNGGFLGWDLTDDKVEAIEDVFEAEYGEDNQLGIQAIREGMREELTAGIGEFTDILTIFGFVVILTGLLLITNIQLMNLEEREQQIGLMRAIGSKKREVLISYGMETVILGILGGILGVIVGLCVALVMNQIFLGLFASLGAAEAGFFEPLSAILDNPSIIIIALVSALVVALATGMAPALRARGASVIEILRATKSTTFVVKKKPLWPIITGLIVLMVASAILVPLILDGKPFFTPEGYRSVEEEMTSNFMGIFLLGLAIILISFWFDDPRLGASLGGLVLVGLVLFGFQIAVDWVEEAEGGIAGLMVCLISGVTGITVLIGVNLDIITDWLRRFLGLFRSTRSIGLIASRYMNSHKSRAVLTFATFAVILSINFFMGSFAATMQYGSEDASKDRMAGVPLLVESQAPIDYNTFNYTQELLTNFPEKEQIEKIYPMVVANDLAYKGEMGVSEKDWYFIKMVEINPTTFQNPDTNEPIYPFIFDDIIEGPYDTMNFLERLKDRDKAIEEAIGFWKAFLGEERIRKDTMSPVKPGESGYDTALPMFIGNDNYADVGIEVGTIFSFHDSTGTGYIEMVFAAQVAFFPSFEYAPTAALVTDETASKLGGFQLVTGYSEFLIEPTGDWDDKYDYDRNNDLADAIEEYSNKDLTDRTGQLYGITALNMWDAVKLELDQTIAIFTFLNIFVSIGLIVGVIGLLVVSFRSVSERKREIGMLRSIGFNRGSIAFAVLLELMFLGILGFIVGFIVGNYAAWAFSGIMGMNHVIDWIQVILFGVLILGSVFLAAFIPGWRGSKIPPSEALRYTG
ncbi:MAG: ABC transporter permease [Promethearchaeota archaeon]